MSEQESQPHVVVERRGSSVVAFLCGALLGAGAALLLAPKSGRETQEDLREGARRLREGAEGRLTDLRETLGDRYGRTREELGERVGAIRDNVRGGHRRAEEAIKVGREAAQRARSDLEARVSRSKEAYRALLAEDPAGGDEGSAAVDESAAADEFGSAEESESGGEDEGGGRASPE